MKNKKEKWERKKDEIGPEEARLHSSRLVFFLLFAFPTSQFHFHRTKEKRIFCGVLLLFDSLSV